MLWFYLFISLVFSFFIATVLALNNEVWLAALPIIIWFILGQIFIVPRILKKLFKRK